MSSPATLFVVILASALGAGYFVFGKREGRASFLLAGAALCIYPYLIDSLWASVLLGLALAAAPFLVDR